MFDGLVKPTCEAFVHYAGPFIIKGILNKENSDLTTIRGSYVMLKHKFEYITKEFHIDEILSIGDKYLKYAQDIESEVVYPANPSILCSYCEFLNLCEEGYEKVGFRQLASQTTSGEVSW
jgi:hypothetical protein